MSMPTYIRTCLLILSATLLPCATSFAASPALVPHIPHLVSSGVATKLGLMATTERLEVAVTLATHDQAGLDVLLAGLYNPQSAQYRQWLTSQEFSRRFGPTAAETEAVVAWAKSEGLTVTQVAPYGRLVSMEGPVAAINHAFHVSETMYHDPNLNRDFHAPDVEPTTDLPFAVNSIDNLENSAPPHNHLKKGPNAGPASGLSPYITAPQSSYARISALPRPQPHVTGSGPDGSYLPSDMRAAYYGSGNLTGAGQSVGIFSFEPIYVPDLQLFYTDTGTTMAVPVTYVATGTSSATCTATCDDGEQILDIAQVEGMAPGLSAVYFFENSSTASPELASMVSYTNIKIFSSSWGGGGFGTASDTYFTQMATQGQTYFNATGDDGALYKSNYDAPSFDPYIVQVGGTDLTTSGPGGSWVSEISWSDSSGGYWLTGMSTSAKYTIPTWQSQTGVVTAANAASTLYRNVPDMAAEANFDNPTVEEGEFLIGYGGTSYAAPRMAAYFALANQQSVDNGTTTGLGAIMSGMYTAGLAQQGGGTGYYHDTTSGTNPGTSSSTGAQTGPTYSSVAGYDLVTGWGSPNGATLLNYFAPPLGDFGLPVSVTGSVVAGSSVGISIPITGYNGYSGTVDFTALSGLPTGGSAVYQAGSTSTPPLLYVSVPTATTPGTITLVATLADSSNSALTHKVTVLLSVEKRASGDFTMSGTPVTINTGFSGTSTITITQGTGLAGPVALAVTGTPVGVTAKMNVTQSQADVYSPQTYTMTIGVPGATTAGTYSVTLTGTAADGIVHTLSVPLTVTGAANLVVNGGFDTGAFTPWTTTTNCSYGAELLTVASTLPAQQGTYFALLDGNTACTQTLSQAGIYITPGATGKATLGFYQWVLTGETGTTAVDTLTVSLVDGYGTSHTLGTLSNLNGGDYYSFASYDVSAYQGQVVTIKFTGYQAGTTYTDFLVDTVSLVAP